MRGRLRFAVDTGGTFTDLIVEGVQGASLGGLRLYKCSTTPDDPVVGVLDVLSVAARDLGIDRRSLLAAGEVFIFGTTRATNAIVTGETARTAFLTTAGHPDTLVLREGGGRATIFDYSQEYPAPYVPRSFTFEIPERIDAEGNVVLPLDEGAALDVLTRLAQGGVEAAAVCFLWSIVNPAHELRMGELISEHLPGLPFTLSHELNPSIREYRRASSAVIDASLKPLMSRFFRELEDRLRSEGFAGRMLLMTSGGGVKDTEALVRAPIHSIGSGPAAGPVAGRYFARRDCQSETAIITDAGGTTYDVSLVRFGEIPWTRETVVGHPIYGFMTGFPSVDVRSVGSAGGSIAWIDRGGLLRVGPQSAGADPGPACYRRGGVRPTVTDAAVFLGYIDPRYFLGGSLPVDAALSEEAIASHVGEPLGLSTLDAAGAIFSLAIEQMVNAIEGITLSQGIDPARAVLVGGGGGGGLYTARVARRLGCGTALIPAVSAGLSATGEALSDLREDFAATFVTSTADFDFEGVNRVLATLAGSCEQFHRASDGVWLESSAAFSAEARYPHQVWEIEVPLPGAQFSSLEDVEEFVAAFHEQHERIFAVKDQDSEVEIVALRARAECKIRSDDVETSVQAATPDIARERRADFPGIGSVPVPVYFLSELASGSEVKGPAIIESIDTSIVLDAHTTARRLSSGSVVLDFVY